MRPGFRDKAHQAGHQQNDELVLLQPSFKMHLVQQQVHYCQCAECPDKHPRHMALGNMIPQVLLQEMIRYCGNNKECRGGDKEQGDTYPVPDGRP